MVRCCSSCVGPGEGSPTADFAPGHEGTVCDRLQMGRLGSFPATRLPVTPTTCQSLGGTPAARPKLCRGKAGFVSQVFRHAVVGKHGFFKRNCMWDEAEA